MRLDSASADRVTALVLFILGAGLAYGGYTMDRLEVRHIHPASIPGLVPMILGLCLMLCAGALAWSVRGGDAETAAPEVVSWPNFLVTVGWSGLYALAAVSRINFVVATAIYIAGFTLWFLRADPEAARKPPLLQAAIVVAFAALTAVAISTLFRYGFLVRLP